MLVLRTHSFDRIWLVGAPQGLNHVGGGGGGGGVGVRSLTGSWPADDDDDGCFRISRQELSSYWSWDGPSSQVTAKIVKLNLENKIDKIKFFSKIFT